MGVPNLTISKCSFCKSHGIFFPEFRKMDNQWFNYCLCASK